LKSLETTSSILSPCLEYKGALTKAFAFLVNHCSKSVASSGVGVILELEVAMAADFVDRTRNMVRAVGCGCFFEIVVRKLREREDINNTRSD
jgi:hypothetical protein